MSPWWIKETDRSVLAGKFLVAAIAFAIAGALSLLIASLYFYYGKVWPGALYLAVAVFMGLVAGKAVLEKRKWRHAKPPGQMNGNN